MEGQKDAALSHHEMLPTQREISHRYFLSGVSPPLKHQNLEIQESVQNIHLPQLVGSKMSA